MGFLSHSLSTRLITHYSIRLIAVRTLHTTNCTFQIGFKVIID